MERFGFFSVILLVVAVSTAWAQERRMIDDRQIQQTTAGLIQIHGEGSARDVARGVGQVAMFWRLEDGTPAQFDAFCKQHFVSNPADRKVLLDRFDKNMEAVFGHQVALARTFREPIDVVNAGDQLDVDLLFASLDPFDHFEADSFQTKVAFVALLNFPVKSSVQLEEEAAELTRQDWAEARLAQLFAMRIPGTARQATTKAYAAAEEYIGNYNIHMKNVLLNKGVRPFPAADEKGLVLISHWNLRDHIKALYATPDSVPQQRLIYQIMLRIIRQEIPAVMVNGTEYDWNPLSNKVFLAKGGQAVTAPSRREDDVRYRKLLDVFAAERLVDQYSPAYPTLIDRRFDHERQLPLERVEALLKEVLEDPLGVQVADKIRQRLGRDLEPFDIWYDGFKVRGTMSEKRLNDAVRKQYPTLEAFAKKLPELLTKLGFTKETAQWLSERMRVDPARGAGHAMGAGMRTDNAHLRTRVPDGGMDYKGYNIAMHELGHTVEQTFSLYRVDRVLMNGVPNTAFTEAMAFLFQGRDLDVLGLANRDEKTEALRALDAFWSTREIAGVSLLDIGVWKWMYEHPDATPSQLREAVEKIANQLWNEYYASFMGSKTRPILDSPLLAIYSHMIAYGLYLPDYTIGHLIQAQFEEFLHKKNLGVEMERWCVEGRLSPDAWMMKAVNSPLSAQSLLNAARNAMSTL